MAAIPPQPDCSIEGARVVIRPLQFRDLPEVAAWEPHSDPLLAPYNLCIDSAAGWRRWLQRRRQDRWPYAIQSRDRVLVGHLSLRQIDHPRSARLAVTLAARYVNQGYGQDAMRAFLDYYFRGLGFEEMRLDVCGANPRARRLYQKLGFKQLNSFWMDASQVQDSDLPEEYRCHWRRGKMRHFEMRLKGARWWSVCASSGS